MDISRRHLFVLGGGVASAMVLGANRDASAIGPRTGPAAAPTAAPIIPVDAEDSVEQIIAKASNVVPRTPQLRWQQHEITAFTHYGMNTMTDREWGSGAEDPSWFDPPRADPAQWVEVSERSGAGLAMFTAKHHEGFVLYPSRYTRHTVVASPWWEKANGRGDLLRAYVDEARGAGLKVGVYLSPADGAELPHVWHAGYVKRLRAKQEAGEPLNYAEEATLEDAARSPSGHGRYGNGSTRTKRTIPTLVDNDDRAERIASGQLPSFTVEADDYNAYYLNQLYELFTEYGPIEEIWLDGANPWVEQGLAQDYDFSTWYRVIKELHPDTLIFQGPVGARWVGNEDGVARKAEWSVIPTRADPWTGVETLAEAEASDLGSRKKITDAAARYLMWFPAECDVSIRPGWFHHTSETPKTATELVELYEASVGRNAVLLLNIPPSVQGRVEGADITEVTRFRDSITATYGHDLLAGGPGDLVSALTDRDLATSWTPDGGGTTGSVVLDLPQHAEFDRIRLGEDISRGQRVEQFTIEIPDGAAWREIAAGTTIGLNRILVLAQPVAANRVRLNIQKSRARPRVATVGLYRYIAPEQSRPLPDSGVTVLPDAT